MDMMAAARDTALSLWKFGVCRIKTLFHSEHNQVTCLYDGSQVVSSMWLMASMCRDTDCDGGVAAGHDGSC